MSYPSTTNPLKISPAWQYWPADKIPRSGKSHYTYDLVLQTILDCIKDPTKRVFLKDMSYHIIPPLHSPNARAPSLQHRSPPSPPHPANPTLLPTPILHSFRFVFLIRNPAAAIPSLHRCFIPPLNTITEMNFIDPTELGYRELRILFDYLYPPASRETSPASGKPAKEETMMPLLIDADDLLADPEGVIRALCLELGFPYSPDMLSWPSEEDHNFALSLFEKYAGFHEDALKSTGLRPRGGEAAPPRPKTREEEDEGWEQRYGVEAAKRIREIVDMCQEDYDYLKGFRMRV
ncbi:MAG: hypothetical protein Q9219_001544 [cf. Caloplaca sp. 3 TL-2023]